MITEVGVPFKYALKFSIAISIALKREALVNHAICAVIEVLFKWNSGLSFFGGSSRITSRPAPYTLPERNASAKASSTINPPLAVLIKMTPSFILANASASKVFSVEGVNGA